MASSPSPPTRTTARAKRALLTEAGMAKFGEAQRLWLGAQRRFEATLGNERAAELRSVLGFIASKALPRPIWTVEERGFPPSWISLPYFLPLARPAPSSGFPDICAPGT